ncbi:MAG TPA: aminotransferase class I/II-fold pyridoxal phosphate-dependent enzyme [Mucilaginibacter sp.]
MKGLLEKAFDPNSFRTTGHQLIETLAGHLAASHGADFHTINWKLPEEQLAYWNKDFSRPLTHSPNELFDNVIANSINLHSPGYLGHQVPPSLPLTALTSALMSFLNNGMAVYEMGMTGNAMEKVIISYLASKFGLGDKASGVVTSGGTLGNLTALLAARSSATDIWENGSAGNQPLAVLVSEEAHYSIDRAARIMGIGKNGVIKIPVNEKFQMRTELLETYYRQATEEGKKVICVVGCSCSTSTGAFDNLQAIGDFALSHKLWFHIDGAHGAPVIFSNKYRYLLKGISKANSIVIDFHKMMMAPSLSTAVVFKDGNQAAHTFSQDAAYIYQNESDHEWFNSGKYTFECTKPATVLHTYAIIRQYGDKLYQENVDILFGLATDFATLVKDQDDFELACEPQSNIVCFRYRTLGQATSLNQAILKSLLMNGKFYIVSTMINREFFLRISIMNPFTRIDDLKLLLTDIRAFAVDLQCPITL